MKKILEVNDDELLWLLVGLEAAEIEYLLPKAKGGKLDERVRQLEKKLKILLYQPKDKKRAT